MNDADARRRFLWLTVAGGALVCAIVVFSLIAPGSPSTPGPDLQVSPQATGGEAGATQEADAGDGSRPGFSLGLGGMASLAWRLGLVAVVMAGAIIGLRWWARKSGAPSSTTGFLRVLDTLAISNGRTIHLVALGRRVIVIGATAQQMAFLNELTVEEADEVRSRGEAPAEGPLTGFTAELLQSFSRQATRSRAGAPTREALAGEDR